MYGGQAGRQEGFLPEDFPQPPPNAKKLGERKGVFCKGVPEDLKVALVRLLNLPNSFGRDGELCTGREEGWMDG